MNCKLICILQLIIAFTAVNSIEISDNEISQSPHNDRYSVHLQFENFIGKFNKKYANEKEKMRRFKIFERNLHIIKLLNENERGTATYGVTEFADLNSHEFRRIRLGLRPELNTHGHKHRSKISKKISKFNTVVPDSFDWRTIPGVVSAVKDQGMCGSCWAFSVTGNVEGIWRIAKNQTVSLSEEELVDCDTLDQGCDGGLMTNAYKAIINLGGIENEKDYPYKGLFHDKCHYNRSLARINIDSYVILPENETFLSEWLVNHGPISIGINAKAMQFYFGGISNPPKWLCKPSDIDHGVLIVGYGIGRTRILRHLLPYWIVKNSWGSSWGEKGYYRVFRGGGTCGINTMATSAWINK